MIRLTWELPAQPDCVSLCRRMVKTVMEDVLDDPIEIDEWSLMAGELSANVVRHAGLHPLERYLVELEVGPDIARLAVTDHGVGFEPALGESPVPTESGGLGLWIVSRLADRMEVVRVDDDRTVVTAERRMKSVHDPDGAAGLHVCAGAGSAGSAGSTTRSGGRGV